MTYSGRVETVSLAVPAAALAALLMLGVWVWHLRLGNTGVVDVGWTWAVTGATALVAALGTGDPMRRWLLAAMVAIWGARLSFYLLRDRVIGRPEDGRYVDLRERGSVVARARFFWFFQAQALIAVFFTLPMLLVAGNGAPAPAAVELTALALWAIALAGERTADRQLERFKARPGTRGRTCRDGLWRYSRHPNYFFEWLIWVAFALYASASPYGWLAIACPAVMLYLLFRVTGIPATEAQALRSRGDDYRRYQRETSAFFPWFPKTAEGGGTP